MVNKATASWTKTLSSLLPNRQREPRIAPKRPARVEPKSFFANERTFIQWTSAALWLLTIAALLAEREVDGTSYLTAAGLVLCTGALVVLVHSLYVYFRRIHLMQTGNPKGYVDRFGPMLLFTAVFCGVITLLVDKSKAKFSMMQPTPSALLRLEAGQCFQHSNVGISTLKYQPSDVVFDPERSLLLVPSLDRIVAHNVGEGSGVRTLIQMPGSDIEGLTLAGDRLFALSEATGHQDEASLVELGWQSETLRVIRRFDVGSPELVNEGLTYIPGTQEGDAGSLCIDRGEGLLSIFDLPPPTAPAYNFQSNDELVMGAVSLTPKDGMIKKMMAR